MDEQTIDPLGEEDVEGHSRLRSRSREDEEVNEDVEGHSHSGRRRTEDEGDEDVEGHSHTSRR